MLMEEEIWKDIDGYEGYQVSNLGNVRSLDRSFIDNMGRKRYLKGKELKKTLNDSGYELVNLSKSSIVEIKRVHRLVADAFLPNQDNLPCVDHINGVRDCNVASNLRWCNYKMNSNYPIAKENMKKSHTLQTNDNLKKKVFLYDDLMNIVKVYESSLEASNEMGCSRSNISKICRNKSIYKGFKWSYKPLEAHNNL